MNIKNFTITIALLFLTGLCYSQTSCASPFGIGTPNSTTSCQTLTTAGNGSSPCAGSGYGGPGGYYYFEFCTNSNTDCIQFTLNDIGTTGNWAITIYESGSCSFIDADCIGDQGTSQIITSNAWGLSPNTCYVGRLWVKTAGTFELCSETIQYPNDDCLTATPIDATPLPDDNICSTPGPTTNTPTIAPGDLCAGSLENTAWYTFTVLNTADVIITIDNIICVGGASGFQIGYFTGSCGALNNIGCQSGGGGTVTATITGLTAGEQVYIAIDGNAGANCTYEISATNTVILPIELLTFEGYHESGYDSISWITATEINNSHFIIQHSVNAMNWKDIDRIEGMGTSSTETAYSFRHESVSSELNYYRLTQYDYDGQYEVHNIIAVRNTSNENLEIVKYVDLMGREIDKYYRGISIVIYDNGTTKMIMKNE